MREADWDENGIKEMEKETQDEYKSVHKWKTYIQIMSILYKQRSKSFA